MKKIYKAPLTKVVKIKSEKMICQSIELQGTYNSETMTIGSKDDYDDEDVFDDLW